MAWHHAPEGIAVSADIECGSAQGIDLSRAGRVSFAPHEDAVPGEVQVKGPISCYNACVALRNEAGEPRDITVEVRIPRWLIEAGFGYFLCKEYLVAPLEEGEGPLPHPALGWRQVPPARRRDRESSVEIDLSLDPGDAIVLSSVEHYPVTACNDRLGELATHPRAELGVIGRSVQGRPILALEAGREDAPRRAVFTGTLQPGEPSAWAVVAMIESVLEGDGRWLDEWRLGFIPQTNPDGIYLGRCNTNARDELVAFGFEEAASGQLCPQEVRVLWDYLLSMEPAVYVDFHFLRQPNHPYTKPYFIDPAIYEAPEVARAAVALNERYMKLSGADRPFSVAIGDEMWRGLAAYQVAAQLDAVSFLYQYTGPTTSLEGAQKIGPLVMVAALEVCRELTERRRP